MTEMRDVPVVLFVCVQNAGRSQMAEAIFNDRAAGRAVARSAGSRPAEAAHPVVVEALSEIGLDVGGVRPKGLGAEVTEGVDVLVTMGCGDECPVIGGARVVDWDLPDPADQPIEVARRIRDEVAARSTGSWPSSLPGDAAQAARHSPVVPDARSQYASGPAGPQQTAMPAGSVSQPSPRSSTCSAKPSASTPSDGSTHTAAGTPPGERGPEPATTPGGPTSANSSEDAASK